MNPYCKKSEAVKWNQYQQGFAHGRAARDAGVYPPSGRRLPYAYRVGASDGYANGVKTY